MLTNREIAEKYPSLDKFTSPVKRAEREIVGREKEMNSLLAAFNRPELCNVILLAEAGSGKAIFDEEMLPVADERGYIRMGDVKVGDKIFLQDGTPFDVAGVFPQGKKRAFRVIFTDGSSVVCNDEHLWSVRDMSLQSGEKIETLTLREIIDKGLRFRDLLSDDQEDNADGYRFQIPINSPVEREPICFKENPLDFGMQFGANIRRDHWSDDRPIIPADYMKGSVGQRQALLEGIARGYGDATTFVTRRFSIVNSLLWLGRSLGMMCHSKWDKEKKEYQVSISLNVPKFRYIENVVDLAIDLPMTCIYIEHESHLFQVGYDHIVTHNTALVQGTMVKDPDRLYLEVDLSKMLAGLKNKEELAAMLKELFGEAATYVKDEKQQLVLFIDEFHLITQLSEAAVEALKPLLADSGTRQIRVIAATTYEEFRKYISPNQPLVERLQRINVPQPGKEMTIKILKGMAKKYGVEDQFVNDHIFEMIYEYTNRYIPANSQPRKSILVLDAMCGWHKYKGRPFDMKLLADVIYESENVNISFRVDATSIKKNLDAAVLSQHMATRAIEERLQICVADLNDPKKPMATMLFSGSTGVGKGIVNNLPIPVYDPNGKIFYKQNGDLKVGDYVFNRKGEPVLVTGVYPQGLKRIYEVYFTDGRMIETDSSHLWTYLQCKGKYSENTYTNSTKELLERGVFIESKKDTRRALKYYIPRNHAIQYDEKLFPIDPYVIGALIGDGCLTVKPLTISSNDPFVVYKVAELIGNCTVVRGSRRNYNWTFKKHEKSNNRDFVYTEDLLKDCPELFQKKSFEKRIPEMYKYGSVEQRWRLIQGLFDTDGSIANNSRYSLTYSSTSKELCEDIQSVLYSLGFSSTIKVARKETKAHIAQYSIWVKAKPEEKVQFFQLDRHIEVAKEAMKFELTKSRHKEYDWIGISNIIETDRYEETTCIMVDDEEHLYQTMNGIVTHNTEMTKQLAKLLFDSEKNLIRFDKKKLYDEYNAKSYNMSFVGK